MNKYLWYIAILILGLLAGCGVKENSQSTTESGETDSQLSDVDTSSQSEGTINKEAEELINQTTENLAPYLDVIGVNTSEDELSVSQEFIDGLDKVSVMGHVGTVAHGYADESDTITIMDWVSNDSFSEENFKQFLTDMNTYYSEKATEKRYENICDGAVWVWSLKDDLWPICYMNDGKANLRWYAKSAAGKTDPDIIDETTASESGETYASSAHNCEVCGKSAIHSLVGFSGLTEWYCDQHYQEIQDTLNMMEEDVAKSSSSGYSGGVSTASFEYDATLEYGGGDVLICASEEAMERYMTAISMDNKGTISEMIMNGEVAYTDNGTKCNIVKRKLAKTQVKILEGTYAGSTVWVVMEAVKEK